MPTQIAIDFGASNTDAVARHADGDLQRWTMPSVGRPSAERVLAVLTAGGVEFPRVEWIAVTGGDRSGLPDAIDGRPLRMVHEVEAIGRGGLALVNTEAAAVVSAGSGTAVVAAGPVGYSHISGTGVGGGTLLGLSRLLIGSAEPQVVDALARAGSHVGVNITIGEIVGGSIGTLPADTTAVNFGRIARQAFVPKRPDMAAGIVNLVGQVIAVVAINAARSRGLDTIVVIGRLTELSSVRTTIQQVGEFYGASILTPPGGAFATAMGALMAAEAAPIR
jgi:type II pantothenate kinase